MSNKVSIIVPIYNAEKYLKRCINSIINQTYKNIEIILVNDGSTDSSLEICTDYTENDNRIIVINQKNIGVSEARKNGVLNATGEYVVFVDSDDYIMENYILDMVKVLEKNDCEIVVCNYTRKETYDLDSENIEILTRTEGFYNLINNDNFGGYVWNKMYLRKKLKEKIKQLFDCEVYVCEDFLLNSIYFSNCRKICYINKKLYFYSMNEDSATGKKLILNKKKLTIIDAYEKIIKIYEKYSRENLDYVLYNFLKVLLYIKYLSKKNNIKVTCDDKIKENWKKVMKSEKISLIKKIYIFFRIKFPFISEDIKNNIFTNIRK